MHIAAVDKYAEDKDGLKKFIEGSREHFSNVSETAMDALEELTHCLPSTESVEGQYDANETAAVINRFLAELPPEKRQMFLRRYWYLDSISTLARRFSLSESAVKSKLHRTRLRLKEVLLREGVAV